MRWNVRQRSAMFWFVFAACGSFLTVPAGRAESQSKPPAATPAPDKRGSAPARADTEILADFAKRVREYVALHKKLEGDLPKLSKEATPKQIDTNQRLLGKSIKAARKTARQGDLFTPEMEGFVRRVFERVFAGKDGPTLKASILDENPGIPKLAVNQRYPDAVPLATMPPDVLVVLPKLDEDLEYRFISDRLALVDTHAHIIVDFTHDVLPI